MSRDKTINVQKIIGASEKVLWSARVNEHLVRDDRNSQLPKKAFFGLVLIAAIFTLAIQFRDFGFADVLHRSEVPLFFRFLLGGMVALVIASYASTAFKSFADLRRRAEDIYVLTDSRIIAVKDDYSLVWEAPIADLTEVKRPSAQRLEISSELNEDDEPYKIIGADRLDAAEQQLRNLIEAPRSHPGPRPWGGSS